MPRYSVYADGVSRTKVNVSIHLTEAQYNMVRREVAERNKRTNTSWTVKSLLQVYAGYGVDDMFAQWDESDVIYSEAG